MLRSEGRFWEDIISKKENIKTENLLKSIFFIIEHFSDIKYIRKTYFKHKTWQICSIKQIGSSWNELIYKNILSYTLSKNLYYIFEKMWLTMITTMLIYSFSSFISIYHLYLSHIVTLTLCGIYYMLVYNLYAKIYDIHASSCVIHSKNDIFIHAEMFT